MASFEEIRQLISECHYRIATDRAALQRMAQELSYTDQVIKRGTLAYHALTFDFGKDRAIPIQFAAQGPQSSSASRVTAEAFGFLTFSQ